MQNWELDEGMNSVSPPECSAFCMLQAFIAMPSAQNMGVAKYWPSAITLQVIEILKVDFYLTFGKEIASQE